MDDVDIALLNDVFAAGSEAEEGVPRLAFRAQRPKLLNKLDELERIGWLQVMDARYVVSLAALPLCSHPSAKALLANAEKIFAYLKAEYVREQHHPIPLTAIASRFNLPVGDVRRAVGALVEAPWWGGRSTLLDAPDAYIFASEPAIRYENLSDIIAQLVSWHKQREGYGQHIAAPLAANALGSELINVERRAPRPAEITAPATFRLGQSCNLEESQTVEFKEVKGGDPVRAIANAADEYAVAFLNAQGGTIYWGIRDEDAAVVGVPLTKQQRDGVRQLVMQKLTAILPHIDPTQFELSFVPLDPSTEDRFVVALVAPNLGRDQPFYTAGREAFVRLNGVTKKLGGPQLTDWIMQRAQLISKPAPSSHAIDQPTASLIRRVRQLLSQNGIEPAHFPRFLQQLGAPFSCSVSDQYTDDALLRWIDEDKLSWLCDIFRVRREWLDGEDDRIYRHAYFDKAPVAFWNEVSAAKRRFAHVEQLGLRFAYFIKAGKGRDWEKKGGSEVYVVVAIPIAALSAERVIYQYITDLSPYPWSYDRTQIQLRAWARLLYIDGFVVLGRQCDMSVAARLGGNQLFLRPLLELPNEHVSPIDWHVEDYALSTEESVVAKGSETLPHVFEFLERFNLPTRGG